jgi:phosphoribosylformylglycinamidine cyclo-ligase
MRAMKVKGLAHITGGGITENVPRMLHAELDAEIDTSSWQQGPVFDWLAEQGNIETAEMRRTFNCGVGMVVVVEESKVDEAIRVLGDQGEQAWRLGRVTAGKRKTRYV